MEHGFPTLGEVVRFLFNSTGVLARKENQLDTFLSEKDKKTLQSRLRRLAAEEGDINKNLNDVLQIWVQHIDAITPLPKVTAAITESIWDLLVQYADLIRNEGTYLDSKQSLYFLLRYGLIRRAVLSSQKNILRFNIKDVGLDIPDCEYWFLPDIDQDLVIWPIEKALRWAYSLTATSQTHFHYPGKNAGSDNFALYQNLENAENWLHGRNLPTWGALHTNLCQSFEAMAVCENSAHQRKVETLQQESIILILFIARTTTYIGQLIEQQFSRDTLQLLVCQYKENDRALSTLVHSNMKNKIESLIASTVSNSQKELVDAIWHEAVPRFWQMISNSIIEAGKQAQIYLQLNEKTVLTEQQKHIIRRKYGSYSLVMMQELFTIMSEFQMPANFARLVVEGEELCRHVSHIQDIEDYQSRLESSEYSRTLQWFIEWARGTLFLKQNNFEQAHYHLGEAIAYSKYCAGTRQKTLIKQYLGICVQLNKSKDFKRVFAWAAYLYIDLPLWTRESDDLMEEAEAMFRIYRENSFNIGGGPMEHFSGLFIELKEP